MACDRLEQLHAYHDGQLAPGQRLLFEIHVEQCPECAALLREMRSLSKMIADAPLPQAGETSNARYYRAWNVARAQRHGGVLRIAGWLTGAAAAVLIGSLLLWPRSAGESQIVRNEASPSWETVALMPPSPERSHDRPDELIEIAQWMADELSADGLK